MIFMHTQTHKQTHAVQAHRHTLSSTHIHTQTHMPFMHIHKYTHAVHACSHTHTYTHPHMHKRTHACTHARTHACMHAHTHTSLVLGFMDQPWLCSAAEPPSLPSLIPELQLHPPSGPGPLSPPHQGRGPCITATPPTRGTP